VFRSVMDREATFEEDGEDQVERPRSRPERRNQCRFYSRSLDPEGRIQLRERLQRRATGAANGQRLSGSGSPASEHAMADRFGGLSDRERGRVRLRASVKRTGRRESGQRGLRVEQRSAFGSSVASRTTSVGRQGRSRAGMEP